jgi:transposase
MAVPIVCYILMIRCTSNYTVTLWQRLIRLDYPVVELSNNLGENAIRPVALGRRNWIHIASKETGPRVAAII